MQKIVLHIPVPSYLKKYLDSTFGQNYQLKHTDELGLLILNTLKNKSNMHYEFSNPDKEKGLVHFTVDVSMSFFDKYGCSLTSNDFTQIRNAIDKTFRTNLYLSAVINKDQFDIDYKQTILKFFETYGILEDDMTYGGIRKDFNRKKEAIRDKLNKFNK